MSAPLVTRRSTILSLPLSQAQCSKVIPCTDTHTHNKVDSNYNGFVVSQRRSVLQIDCKVKCLPIPQVPRFEWSVVC